MKTLFTVFLTLVFLHVLYAQETGGPYSPDENTVLLMHFDGDVANSAAVGNNEFTTEAEIIFAQLPFVDDFEEQISNDATFTKWTTENLEGWHYWHIIPGQHMRFENTDIAQNDWLITKQITGEKIENVSVSFNVLHSGNGVKPKLLYTNHYNGDAGQSSWTEIEYNLGDNENEWHNTGDIILENPGNTLYFAFHYEAEANQGIYLLLDNFRVHTYTPPPVFDLVGSSEHFEFYSNIAGETDYWEEIREGLESSFNKYVGIWNTEESADFINKTIKTKIYYTDKSNIPLINEKTPETKSGFFDRGNKTIYLAPLNTPEKQEYYQDLEGLALNTFAGYAKKYQLFRDQDGNDDLPNYFIEGFGLYEQGFRPRLDSIVNFRSKHSGDLNHEDLDAMNVFGGTSQKDIIVSYVEGQIVCSLDYFGTAPHGSFPPIWNNYLVYFYDTTDVVRIKKYASSENFDIYCSSRDTMFIDSFFVWLDRTRQFYIDSFQIEVNRKYNLVIYYDEKTGMDMTGYDNWNGGSGGMNISPHNFGLEDFPWLLAHEFGHVCNGIIYPEMPFGFYHEGMANFSGFIQYNADWANSRPRIENSLYQFYNRFGREPTLDEFIDNPYYGTDCDLDPYYYGLEFIRHINELYGKLKIKEFFQKGMDFKVFSQTHNEIEADYIKRLKLYRNLYPKDTIVKIPFQESFVDFANGWTKPSYQNPDNWQIDDGGTNGINCARFYTNSDKNVPIESWLISPALDTKNMEHVHFSFDFARFGDGIELEVFYTDKFKGYTNSTNWTSLKSVVMPTDWGWSCTGEITISNPPDTLFIGLRKKSPGEQHMQLYIDNFKVEEKITSTEIEFLSDNNFSVYPNPITSQSIVTFQTKTRGKVNLSVFNIQGRKICTLLDENLNAGTHTIQFGNQIHTSGVFLCKLTTSEGFSTIKLVVK